MLSWTDIGLQWTGRVPAFEPLLEEQVETEAVRVPDLNVKRAEPPILPIPRREHVPPS